MPLYVDVDDNPDPDAHLADRPGHAIAGALRRWVDSFRRAPEQLDEGTSQGVRADSMISPTAFSGPAAGSGVVGAGGGRLGLGMGAKRTHGGVHYFDLQAATLGTAHNLLARELKARHLQMIAMGGSIGTGLFVASGKALSIGGPASLLVAYLYVGVMLFCTMNALGELAVVFPVSGSFSAFSTRFIDPSWGFAMGWNYALQWSVTLPLEIIAAALTIEYWNHRLDKSLFSVFFTLIILTINLFGVKAYGEAEFVFALVKVAAVIGFVLLGIVINIGGTPDDGYIGGKYWNDPGAFHNGFKGLCSVLVTAAFAFAGTEMVGLAAAETANPRKSLPTAVKQVFWRITLFYIMALALIGLLVPYTEPRLLGAQSIADAAASPFVIAIESAGIEILPSVMNTVILVSVISVGNSAVFGASRTLAALADQGQAPRILRYVDRRGRPLIAIFCGTSLSWLAFISDGAAKRDLINWLLAISGVSSVLTWGSVCTAHIRFRRAWALRGRTLGDLGFASQAGVVGSYIGLSFNILVLVAQFWTVAWPIQMVPGPNDDASGELIKRFMLQYMSAPLVLLFYLSHKLWFKTTVVRVEDIDIDTGRRDFNLPLVTVQESEERQYWPTWKKWYKFFC